MRRGAARTIYFKYAVVAHYRQMQERKKMGLCNDPGTATRIHFGGITNGQISGWAKMEDKLRSALLNATHNSVHRRGRKLDSDAELVHFKSRAARKLTLHPGVGRKFAAAEAEVHRVYREKRARGLRVKGHFLRVEMKRQVRAIYGDVALEHFKASQGWLFRFAKHYDMSFRVANNKKNLSVVERAGKCKRWHARFRRRLSRGRQLDPKWGRWLPQDRLSLDQVSSSHRLTLR